MKTDMKTLFSYGFVIYPKDSNFILEKYPGTISAPKSEIVLPPIPYDSYEKASEAAMAYINDWSLNVGQEFSVIVRYNRGLGVEYKTLPSVRADTQELAQAKGDEEARKIFPDPIIIHEVRVRPVF